MGRNQETLCQGDGSWVGKEAGEWKRCGIHPQDSVSTGGY